MQLHYFQSRTNERKVAKNEERISASGNKAAAGQFMMKGWRIDMTAFFDFLIRALPWIAIGLFVACSCVAATTKSEGKKLSRIFRGVPGFLHYAFYLLPLWTCAAAIYPAEQHG